MDKQHAHGEQPYQHGQYHHGNDAANFPCDISQSHIVHVRNLPEYLRIFQAAENMASAGIMPGGSGDCGFR